jgi:hypothetical protein
MVLSKEIILNRLNNLNVKLIDDYIVGIDKISLNKKCVCLICNHGVNGDWQPSLNNLFRKFGCPSCADNLPRTNEIVDCELLDEDRTIKRIGNYINALTPIDWECLVCACIWLAAPDSVLNKKKTDCPDCTGRTPKTKQEIVKNLYSKDIELLEDYIVGIDSMQSKKTYICKICNRIWNTTITSIINNNTGCPDCKLYKNQRIAVNIFKSFDQTFQSEYSLSKINILSKSLRFDIYSSKYRIAIEYDGEQHFRPVKFGSMAIEQAKKKFITLQNSDQYKNNFCKENNIKLIRIDGRKYKDQKLVNYINKVINDLNIGII